MIGQKLSDLNIIYILSYGNFTTIFLALKYSICFSCKFFLNNMPAKNKKEVGKLWIDTNWKVLNECVREDFALLIFSIFTFAKLVFHFHITVLKMHTYNAYDFKQYNIIKQRYIVYIFMYFSNDDIWKLNFVYYDA